MTRSSEAHDIIASTSESNSTNGRRVILESILDDSFFLISKCLNEGIGLE